MIIVSGGAVDLVMDALTGMIRGDVLISIDVGLSAGVNVNMFTGVMGASEFDMPGPLKGSSC